VIILSDHDKLDDSITAGEETPEGAYKAVQQVLWVDEEWTASRVTMIRLSELCLCLSCFNGDGLFVMYPASLNCPSHLVPSVV